MEEKRGERVAVVEAMLEKHVLPMLQRMDEKLDQIMNEKASKESVREAHERLARVEVALQGKADKTEVREIRDKMLLWTGALIVIGWMVTKFGDRLFTVLFAK